MTKVLLFVARSLKELKDKTVNVGLFCVVLDDSFKEHGVAKGDVVYLAGDHMMQLKEDDPYNFRRIFVAAFTDNGHVDANKKPFLIDGKRLRPVGKNKQSEYEALKEVDFKKEEVVDEASD